MTTGKNSRKDLKVAQRRLTAIIENAPVGLVIADNKPRIKMIKKRAKTLYDILGYSY